MQTTSFQSDNIWDKLAVVYRDKFMDLELYRDSYDFVCTAVTKQNATVLDVGCGPGIIAKYLLSQRSDFRIRGIDSAPNMVALAAELIPGASFKVMDVRAMRGLNEVFDAIVCGFCLPYLTPEEGAQLVRDAVDALQEEGVFYLSFVEGDPQDSGERKSSTGVAVYFNYYRTADLEKLLTAAGFRELNKFEYSYRASDDREETHVVLVARKVNAS